MFRQDCNPQNMANILWAFATLDVQPGTALLEAGAHRMLELLPTTKPQALSNTMWAFATLGYNPGVLCRGLCTNEHVQHHVGVRHLGMQPRHAVPIVVCKSGGAGLPHAGMPRIVPPGCCRLLRPRVLAVVADLAVSLEATCAMSSALLGPHGHKHWTSAGQVALHHCCSSACLATAANNLAAPARAPCMATCAPYSITPHTAPSCLPQFTILPILNPSS